MSSPQALTFNYRDVSGTTRGQNTFDFWSTDPPWGTVTDQTQVQGNPYNTSNPYPVEGVGGAYNRVIEIVPPGSSSALNWLPQGLGTWDYTYPNGQDLGIEFTLDVF